MFPVSKEKAFFLKKTVGGFVKIDIYIYILGQILSCRGAVLLHLLEQGYPYSAQLRICLSHMHIYMWNMSRILYFSKCTESWFSLQVFLPVH